GGRTYVLERPFFILATQNPIEQSGTFVLPEAQQDRFLLYIKIGYPDAREEEEILRATTGTHRPKPEKAISGEEILRLQQLVREEQEILRATTGTNRPKPEKSISVEEILRLH